MTAGFIIIVTDLFLTDNPFKGTFYNEYDAYDALINEYCIKLKQHSNEVIEANIDLNEASFYIKDEKEQILSKGVIEVIDIK